MLDELIEAGTVPTPDYMKIDVEGAELAVLHGAARLLQRSVPTIFLSLHGDDLRQQCLELLKCSGYRVRPLDGETVETTSEIIARR